MKLLQKLRALFRRKQLDTEMAEEMREHLERRTQANLAAGMSAEDARFAAQRQFGGVEQLKEIAREQRGWVWLEEWWRDSRFALRQLANSPGFAVVAVLTLAVALGVNSAVFALVNATVLRPVVPLRPEEVVNLFNGQRAADPDFRPFAYAEYLALRDARDTFADVAATRITSAGIASEQGGVRRSTAFFTSENYFALLGVQPERGRFYDAAECRPNAGISVVVASHALWQREGGGSDFVGRTLRINGQSYTVIGVTPAGFNGVSAFMAVDLWVPLGVMSQFSGVSGGNLALADTHLLNLMARLAPGLEPAAFASHLALLGPRLSALQTDASGAPRELHAEAPSRQGVSSQPSGPGSGGPLAVGLMSMAGCVLLIACLNLANMLLARGASREKEIALRLALGAGRWRVVRQLLAEGLLLAGVGGALGLLFAAWGNGLLVRSFATIVSLNGESSALDARPDGTVLGVTFLLGLVATVAFSLGPALKASRADLVSALKAGRGDSAGTGRFQRFFSGRHCLVMGQIALSLGLLFSAALFLRSAIKAGSVDPGFDPAGVLVADFDYSLTSLSPEAARRSLFSALGHLATRPGVQSVAFATFVPYSPRLEGRNVQRAGEATGGLSPNASASVGNVVYAAVTDGYFDTVGARLVRGRDFTTAEARDPSVAGIAIIDETLAKKLFPGEDAVGRRIRVGSVEREIVGICAPHRHNARRPDLPLRVFVPYAANHDGRAFALIRLVANGASAAGSVASLRASLRALDADLPLQQLTPFSRLVEQDTTAWMARMGAILFGLFGAIALLLAVVGVYGVKAYAVAQRTREIGIRMAVGAQPGDVFALLLKQGAVQVLVAVGIGLLLALGAGKILAQLLYQVSPTDPLALGASAALLSAAALLACFVPARRATKINPLVALRAE